MGCAVPTSGAHADRDDPPNANRGDASVARSDIREAAEKDLRAFLPQLLKKIGTSRSLTRAVHHPYGLFGLF
jgi:hypothetical protein